MATPTPTQPPNPPSASKRPTHAASTPLTQTTSPAHHAPQQPRSHPSPTTTRTATAAKTPTNHPTASSTKTASASTPAQMLPSLSASGFLAPSPATGIELTPGALAMVPSMSELGLGLSLTASGGAKRNEDEERRARMRRVLKRIGVPRGRVSEEGIARAGRRVGFANDIDAEVLTAEERERKVGNRTVSIAGEAVVVDVELRGGRARGVQVLVSGEGEGVRGVAERAGEVLLEALRGDGGLEGFARGLEWIARVDRVGGGRVSGFEALGGVFGALRRLWVEEVRGMGEEGGMGAGEKAEWRVLCKKSGRPVAHERGGLGISLDYWQDERGAALKKSTHDAAMDIDSSPRQHAQTTTATTTTPPSLHTLHLDLDRCPPEMYPPIRISSTWLPTPLTLSPQSPIPWQDPPPTFLSAPSTNADDPQQTQQQQQQQPLLPSLRFLARLDPPIPLPWQTACSLLTSLSASPPQAFQTPPLLHNLLIPSADLERAKSVFTPHGDATHAYRLHVARPDFGFGLEELPFAHPRQLVESLPLLRQWAVFGGLVRDVFGASGPAVNDNGGDADGARGGAPDALAVDVALATSPEPTLSLAFATRDGEREVAVRISVGLNGEVGVGGRVAGVDGDVAVEGKRARRWARALEVCGSVGVWVEWVRGEEAK